MLGVFKILGIRMCAYLSFIIDICQLLVYNGDYNTDDWSMYCMIENLYDNFIKMIRKFTNNTSRSEYESSKRTENYLEWCSLKTDIVDNEDNFSLTEEQSLLIKRGNVIWVNFGFNIGSEFGGHHPAVIIRKMGKGVYVIPLDSGKVPESKKGKDYYISIPYMYGLPKIPRHCNVYKMVCIDPRRFDFNGTYGNVHGKIMNKISEALKNNVIY